MSIGGADVAKGLVAVWSASTLDATFQALWNAGTSTSRFTVLNDQEAPGGQPFPYVIFEQTAGDTTDRMTGDGATLREIRDVPIEFRVHAREVSGDARSAKKIAADLAEAIQAVFGGHPSTVPTGMTLDNGNHLITEYQTDWGIREGDAEYQWSISYLIRIDVPLAV